jgi:hypothetical protein
MGSPRLESRLALLLAVRACERRVLPEFSPAYGAIGECCEDPIDGAVQEVLANG